MKIKYAPYFLFYFLLVSTVTSAQYIQVNDNYTAQQLVDALVGNSCAQVSNVSLTGWSGSSGSNSYGYFTAGTSGFPFTNGVVLSTGFAASAPGPNNSLLSEGSTDWPGDTDLQAALNVGGTVNATVLEFDFIPFTEHISFDYIFASEQYLTSITSQNQCNYTDGFAFLLKEAGSTSPYENLAVVPGTDIPVKVNTVRGPGVCPEANQQYFAGFNGTNHPINFNGQTVILKAESDVVAGRRYHIKLVVADQGNNLYDSAIFLGGGSFNATTSLGADRLVSAGNPLCTNDTLPLDVTNPNATGYQWYKDGVALNGETRPQYTIRSQGVYTVAIQFTTACTSEGKITVEYTTPPPTGTYTLLQCDDDGDGITTFNLELANDLVTNNDRDLRASYFTSMSDAATASNVITNNTAFENNVFNQLYARVENRYGCFSISTVDLATSTNPLTNPSDFPICDEDGVDDGIYVFNLTLKNPEILQALPANLQLQYFTSPADALTAVNAIQDPTAFRNTIAGGQNVYARIYNASDCYSIVALKLIVYSFGGALTDEEIILCTDSTLQLAVPAGYKTYTWNTTPVQNTPAINVSDPGTYTVTVTNSNDCVGTKTFTLLPSGPATGAAIDVKDFAGIQNSISILPQGPGDYEYSLDGTTYQDNNVFYGMPAGKYTVYINDKNGCTPVYKETVYVLDYPKFFTPNGDNVNETWRIPYLNFQPNAVVTIYDRYGKIITSFKGAAPGWDGTYNNKPMPSTDYWFVIQLDNNRIIKGHFAMIR